VTSEGARSLEGPIRRIGVVLRRRNTDVANVVERLSSCCAARGVMLAFEPGASTPDGAQILDLASEPPDLVIALGGDGTLLRAARLVMSRGIPVFGVNLGRLGFLTGTSGKELETGIEQILDGEARLDHRFTLRAEIRDGSGATRDTFFALNDIVVHTSGAARVTPVTLHMGRGEGRDEIGSFSADGVILATPTGSTAYSMSAGGPIVAPDVECLVVTAICPHSLAVRPLVVPASEEITVAQLDPDSGLQLTVDGQVERALQPEETVVVAKAEYSVALVRLPGQSFLRTMRRKLNWAVRPPEHA